MSCLQEKKINVEEYYIDGVKQDLVDNTTNIKLRKNSIDMLDNAKLNKTDINKWKDEINLDDIIEELTKVQTQIALYNIKIQKNITNLEQADDDFDTNTPELIKIIQRVNYLYKRVELIKSGELLLIQEAEDAISNATYITVANATKKILAGAATPIQTTSPTYETVCDIYNSIDDIFKKLTTTLTIPSTDFGTQTVGASVVQPKAPLTARGTLISQLTGATTTVVVTTTSGTFDTINAIYVNSHANPNPTPTAVDLSELPNVSRYNKKYPGLITYAERLMGITPDDGVMYDSMIKSAPTAAAEGAPYFSLVRLEDTDAILNLKEYIMVPNRFKILFGFNPEEGTEDFTGQHATSVININESLAKEFKGRTYDKDSKVTQTLAGQTIAKGTLDVTLPSTPITTNTQLVGHNTFSVNLDEGIFKVGLPITIDGVESSINVVRVEDISLRHEDAWKDYIYLGVDGRIDSTPSGTRTYHINEALASSKKLRDAAPQLMTRRIFVGDGKSKTIIPSLSPYHLPNNEAAFDLYVMGGCSIENKLNKLLTPKDYYGKKSTINPDVDSVKKEINNFKTSIYCKYTAFCNSIRVGRYGVYCDTNKEGRGFDNYTLSVGGTGATGKNSFALGDYAIASGDNTFAVGRCTVTGKNSLGFQSQRYDAPGLVGSANSLSIGSKNFNRAGTPPTYYNTPEINAKNKIIDIEWGRTWGAKNSVTIGFDNYTWGEASVCIGNSCHTGANGSQTGMNAQTHITVRVDEPDEPGGGNTALPEYQYAKVKGLVAIGNTRTSSSNSASYCIKRETYGDFAIEYRTGARYAAIGFNGNSISIDDYGMVGIGRNYTNGSTRTTNGSSGRAPLHVFGGAHGGTTDDPNDQDGITSTVSLRIHNGKVFMKEGNFYKSSDERIKKNITDIPGDVSLQMVRDIECKYYEYKDTKLNANKTMGFIAQQVYTVLPTAVSIISEFIFSEQRISTEHTWEPYQIINEDTASSVTKYKLTILDLNETSGEQLYRFRVSDNLENGDEEIETISLKDEHNSFIFDKIYEHVFICGKHANDSHVLDYDKVFCLNIPATKEIDRIQQIEKERVSVLEEKTSAMKARLSEIESILANLSTV